MTRFIRLVLTVVLSFQIFAIAIQSPTKSSSSTRIATPAAGVQQSDQGNPDVKVWVNTNSSVYHCPGTRWYGRTKSGVYMTQAEAQKKGYRPAYGKVCR